MISPWTPTMENISRVSLAKLPWCFSPFIVLFICPVISRRSLKSNYYLYHRYICLQDLIRTDKITNIFIRINE
jgi:hypothetical protein